MIEYDREIEPSPNPPRVRLPADAPAWGVRKLPIRTAAVASIFDYIPRFGDDL